MKNSVNLIGRIGKDAEVKNLENGKTVINFSLATTETYKDRDGDKKENTEWHQCEMWVSENSTLGQYLNKGVLISVDGKIKNDKYEKEVGGETVTIPTSKIVVDELLLLSSSTKSEDEGA